MTATMTPDDAMELSFLLRQHAKTTIALNTLGKMEKPTVPNEDMEIRSTGRDRNVTIIPREVIRHMMESGAFREALSEYRDSMALALQRWGIEIAQEV